MREALTPAAPAIITRGRPMTVLAVVADPWRRALASRRGLVLRLAVTVLGPRAGLPAQTTPLAAERLGRARKRKDA